MSRSAGTPPRFAQGDRVRVRGLDDPPLHHRTPLYIQGRVGRVERLHGAFRDPSLLAVHKPGLPRLNLYMIAFDQRDLWGPDGPDGALLVDVYEPWLEPA